MATGIVSSRGAERHVTTPESNDYTPEDEKTAQPLDDTERVDEIVGDTESVDEPLSDTERVDEPTVLDPDDVAAGDDVPDVQVESESETSNSDSGEDVVEDDVDYIVDTGGKRSFKRAMGGFRAGLNADVLKMLWSGNSVPRIAVLSIAVYCACVGAAYFLLMQPTASRLHHVKEEKAILHDYSVIQEAGAVIGDFKDGLMTGDQRLTVMSEVRLMATGAGVNIVGDPELLVRHEASKQISEYPIKMRLKGTYHEIGEFLALLEGSPRFIRVEEVEMWSDADSGSRDSEATVLLALASWEG